MRRQWKLVPLFTSVDDMMARIDFDSLGEDDRQHICESGFPGAKDLWHPDETTRLAAKRTLLTAWFTPKKMEPHP